MRPKRIILIRHAESEGNVDLNRYGKVPSHRLDLTDRGHRQAAAAGVELRRMIGDETVCFYVSPYQRARQTFQGIRRAFADEQVGHAFEDPRLREQDWGHFVDADANAKLRRERKRYGQFYYRFKDGESGADVFDRVSVFLETLHRDFNKDDFPRNVIMVTHGLTMRLFFMRWLHWSVEKFERVWNPENCEFKVLEMGPDGRYALSTPFLEDPGEEVAE